ncbi:MAG: SUMF1/EgtB/PvdO family nonheme iron enzyme [Lewinellaceae bacterium]|nr:SUMF1/EgtB/PvdO family nonheme iron enzyme [Lewinellaceae bacterium]
MKQASLCLLLFAAFALSSSAPNASLRPGKDYALFFAVNDYAPDSGFDDLSKPIENAEAIAKELRERYGFQTEIVKNPTLDQISAKLREYQSFYTKNPQGRYPSTGQLLIYFTGHGIAEDNNGYFVPTDGNVKKLYSTAFAYEIWRPFINRIDCRHILLAIDACYSVTFDPDWYNRKMDGDNFTRPGELSEGDKLLVTNETDKSRIVFTSDGSEDKVPERSNFARKFLEALQKGPRQDGILTSEGLAGYLRFAAPKPRLTEFGDDQKGSFLFVSVAPVATDPAKSAADAAANDEMEKDLQAWRTAKAANTIAAYQDYTRRFQNGEFREQAQANIRAIEQDLAIRRDDLAWQMAEEKNTPEGYQKYLADYPNGRHRAEAAEKNISVSSLPTSPAVANDGLILIRGGTFEMGCTSEQQDCHDSEKPAHRVTVGDFYLGKYEVTQKLWQEIMGNNPSNFKNCDNCPVEQVSWDDVQEFLQKLNAKYPGRNYRLPTEAEWEYAARGGGKAILFGNGRNIADSKEINFDASASYKKSYSLAGEYRAKTVPVGSLNSSNALGLHDMSGNVWEWCSDWYGTYASGSQTNPTGPASGSYRVLRGGSWSLYPQDCRVANRYDAPGNRKPSLGFRLARSK